MHRVRDVEVCVVGAGFSGLATAARLREAGLDDVLLLEREERVGGTWRDNTYPGCACDVPSDLYALSSGPDADWSRRYAPQPEILRHLERAVDDLGVRRWLRLGTELHQAGWDRTTSRWRLDTSGGPMSARVLVAAGGSLARPCVPDVPGLGSFAGPSFHTARWDPRVDLTGRRVAVVGTGASAVQVVPALQPLAAHLTVFQRTPPWVLPRGDRRRNRLELAARRRLPGGHRAARAATYWSSELRLAPFLHDGPVRRLAQRQARRHLRSSVPDPALRQALTPGYAMGCKRVLLSDDYYRALTRHNVDVVPAAVGEVRPHALVDVDGVEHPVDAVVWATGFDVLRPPLAERITGTDGRTLERTWAQDGMRAYLGTAVAGFPNLFLLLGPNTGLAHSSVVLMAEWQADYVVSALTVMHRSALASLEVRMDEQDRYTADLRRRLEPTVWHRGGCRSWYLDASGENVALWPRPTFAFRRRTRRFDVRAYRVSPSGK